LARVRDISGKSNVSQAVAASYGDAGRPAFLGCRAAPAAGAIVVDRIGAAQAQRHIADWRDLMARSLEPNVFLDPAFALAAARIAPRVEFLLVWEGEAARRRLIALWPVAPRSVWPAAPVRGWTHDYACSGAPLLDRERAATALSALIEVLRSVRASALVAPQVRRDGPTSAFLNQFARRRGLGFDLISDHARAALVLDVQNDAPAVAASAKKRKEWRRQTRRLHDRGPLGFGMASGGAELAKGIEDFLRIEASGWKGGNGGAFRARPGHADFLRETLAALAESGKVRLYWLACSEKIVACNIMLIAGDEAFFWKTAFDQEFAFASPGVLLTIRMTEALQGEAQLRLVDSCATADHPMIDPLWRGRVPVADIVLGLDAGREDRFRRAVWFERQRRNLREAAKSVWMRLLHGRP
jgi:CelD/BcsL family acetyltransferase involved in cellulose biosynthesis